MLCYGTRELQYEALVDSGADVSLFDWEIANDLGIEATRGTPCEVLGVGGGISVYYFHAVTLTIGDISHKTRVGFTGSPAGQTTPYGILGQRGLFDKFIVGFDLLREEITLKLRK
jgi:hypothetical protein